MQEGYIDKKIHLSHNGWKTQMNSISVTFKHEASEASHLVREQWLASTLYLITRARFARCKVVLKFNAFWVKKQKKRCHFRFISLSLKSAGLRV